MPRYSHRSRTRRRSRGRFGPLFKLLCVVAVIVALTVGATVFFRVETVTVTGNQRYTEEEIVAASGIQLGDNLYSLNKVRIDRNLRRLRRVASKRPRRREQAGHDSIEAPKPEDQIFLTMG